MSAEASEVMICQSCGASVYPEMLEAGRAARVAGKLLCPHCLHERGAAPHAAAGGPAMTLAAEAGTPAPPVGAPARAGITFDRPAEDRREYRRPVDAAAPYATRCRTFHCKLSDASFAHLDHMINEFFDSNPQAGIKFATSSIGVVEGKHADPHLIVTVFY